MTKSPTFQYLFNMGQSLQAFQNGRITRDQYLAAELKHILDNNISLPYFITLVQEANALEGRPEHLVAAMRWAVKTFIDRQVEGLL